MATDHLEADELRALSVGDLFDVVARHGLHFDQSRQAGIVFHMISSITEHGRVGMTAVGDTPDQAMGSTGGRSRPARRSRRGSPGAYASELGEGPCNGCGMSHMART